MSSFEHVARSNRLKNAGGCYPDAVGHAVTLAILLKKLAKVDKKERTAMSIVALFIWLTQDWGSIDDPRDIPDFIKISGSTPCQEHAFRTYFDGTESWAEYARLCKDKNNTVYLWQPLPPQLNKFFQSFIAAQSYDTPFLTKKGKITLFELMHATWKTPRALAAEPRVRKNSFFRYFTQCVQIDNTLGPITTVQLIEAQQAHHKSAMHYQTLDSDRIRYKIFEAQDRYLSRLIDATRRAKLYRYYDLFQKDHSVNLIDPPTKKAEYLLSQQGRISQFQLDNTNHSRDKVCSKAIKFGSRRSIEDTYVSEFFSKLDKLTRHPKILSTLNNDIDKHPLMYRSDLYEYYKNATYRIAFLFIVLTGARPTHSISILSDHYSGGDIVFIKDKGRYRQLILCDYLQNEIRQYLVFQSAVRIQFNSHFDMNELWYEIDIGGTQEALTSRKLRLFMHQLWPNVVPYQLRHFFCYCANSHTASEKLFDQDIDRLMGHEKLGEHLGSDFLSPAKFNELKTYLNTLPKRLKLKVMTYV
ncbi:hypothetical protein [Pseudoalteromonas sp. SWYJZ12]|uniref:hypothetical protein n=1 Tax=Pseudoalteromonas sp. SWYJZ12 TaxID=2792067 RepID=UPI0018CF0102|nr:hypothetical protein [Pseudoalteromonas sp. SWYJZ12]MBH0002725.1 hypothetical protein [Pseudoalteromonas sp. SWYJZ12]